MPKERHAVGYTDLDCPAGLKRTLVDQTGKNKGRNTMRFNEDLLSPSATPSGATPDKPYDEQ